jgi:hypothetical protein
MQNAHSLLHMDLNFVFVNKVQILYKYIYLQTYILMPMGYICEGYINL